MTEMHKSKSKLLLVLAAFAMALLFGVSGGRALAQEAPRLRPGQMEPGGARGQILLTAAQGVAPVELAADGDGYAGAFVIRNVGPGPLSVSRVAVRTSASDPRTPPGVSVQLDGGGLAAKIPPGGEKRAVVRWSNVAAARKSSTAT